MEDVLTEHGMYVAAYMFHKLEVSILTSYLSLLSIISLSCRPTA